jgi:hypothetical protein
MYQKGSVGPHYRFKELRSAAVHRPPRLRALVILAAWQGPSETAISLSLRLRRFRGRRQTGAGAFEAMRCRVQSGRRIQRISETLDVGWSSGAPIGAEPFVNRSLLP